MLSKKASESIHSVQKIYPPLSIEKLPYMVIFPFLFIFPNPPPFPHFWQDFFWQYCLNEIPVKNKKNFYKQHQAEI